MWLFFPLILISWFNLDWRVQPSLFLQGVAFTSRKAATEHGIIATGHWTVPDAQKMLERSDQKMWLLLWCRNIYIILCISFYNDMCILSTNIDTTFTYTLKCSNMIKQTKNNNNENKTNNNDTEEYATKTFCGPKCP